MAGQSESNKKGFSNYDQALKCLSKIRCLEACAENLNKNLTLPSAVGYVPKYLYMKSQSAVDLPIFKNQSLTKYKNSVRFTSRHCAHVDGHLEFNSDGIWGRLLQIMVEGKPIELEDGGKLWLLLCSFNLSNTLFSLLVPCNETDDLIDETMAIESSWMEMASRCFLPFGLKDGKAEELVSSAESYSNLDLPSWTSHQDEQLCHLISKNSKLQLKDLVENIKVSSDEENQGNLLNSNLSDVWSPTSENEQFIEIKLRPGIYVERFGLRLSRDEMSSMTCPIVVTGGTPGNMEKLFERTTYPYYTYPGDEFWLVQKQKTYLKFIRVTFTLSHAGEVRISGLLLTPLQSEIECFNFFNQNLLSIHPKLSEVRPEVLCKRALVLKRIMKLYDSCLLYLYPNWNTKEPSRIVQKMSKHLQHLLPLSEMRETLANLILEKSELEVEIESSTCIKINRRITNDEEVNADNKKSVFFQIYSQITSILKPHHYRCSGNKNQWWVCQFINESVSDQGGGFRDSLTNIAEELCPNSNSKREPVFSLFIASPNQRNPDANDSDTYIPNGSCREFPMYKWIGNIMGGCVRTRENIAISLPKFFWKMFVNQEVTWKDYVTVDQKEVTDLSLMEKMDKTMFDAYFLDTRTWSHVLSDGSSVELKKDGENVMLQFEDRLEYIKLAKEARLHEFKAQVDALREGFLEVVPMCVLNLFTIEELEEMICGKPIVTFLELKDHVKFRYSYEKQQVEMFWKVLEALTDEERSRFLKFTSGRKRLPVRIEVHMDIETLDILPTSSTCSATFHLPKYSSFAKALSMIRYAINTCETIDTD